MLSGERAKELGGAFQVYLNQSQFPSIPFQLPFLPSIYSLLTSLLVHLLRADPLLSDRLVTNPIVSNGSSVL